MTHTNDAAPRSNRLLKFLAWSAGVFVVLIVVFYLVATSAAFLKGVILPRVGASLNSQITVGDASISPFKEVVLRDFKLQPNNAETLVTAREVRANYRLMDIIRGHINIDQVVLTEPSVTLVTKPDGSSNLDPLLKSMQGDKGSETDQKKAEEPAQVQLRKLAITGATVRLTQLYQGGNQDVTELSKGDVTLENIGNGQTSKLLLTGVLAMDNHPPDGTTASLQAAVNGQFDLALDKALGPASVHGNSRLTITQAQGGFAALNGLSASLEADITPSEIKQALLRFQKGDVNLGELRASGPFSMESLEGKIQVALLGVDKKLLNLAGADLGMDFGNTRLEATNLVNLTKGGSAVAAAGTLNLYDFQVTRTNQTTPVMNLRTAYDVSVDVSNSVAVLRELSILGTQKNQDVVRGGLSSPMQIAWGEVSNAVGDSVFELAVNHFNLADWRAFAGDYAPEGIVQAKMKVASKGKVLDFSVDSQIADLTVIATSNRIAQLNITFATRGKATDLAIYDIADLRFKLAQAERQALAATAKGVYNLTNETANFEVVANAALPAATQLLPMPELSITSGAVDLQARVSQKAGRQMIVGDAMVTGLSGRFGSNVVRGFGLTADLDIALDTNRVDVSKLAGNLTEAGKSAGTFSVAGDYRFADSAANLDITASVVLPVVAKLVPDPALSASAGVAELKAKLAQKNGRQLITGTAALSDFTGGYGSNMFQAYGTTVDLDLAMDTNRVDINKLAGHLTQAGKPGGTFSVTGNYRFADSAADLKIGLENLNQNALKPMLEPLLAGKQLQSVSIYGSTDVRYHPETASTVKGSLQMTNLVVIDPAGKLPATPLELTLRLDADMKKDVLDLRQAVAALTPTERAKNEILLKGRLDLSNTNYAQGQLSLTAESLDLTRYYDLLMSENTPESKGGATKPPGGIPSAPVPTGDPEKEPDKLELPVRNFTADLQISRFYLHELEATNIQGTLKLDGGKVTIAPFNLTLNGAPVKSMIDLDLGVPGYKYAVDFSAVRVPFAPLVNTFTPERKGQIEGTITAVANVSGMGVTGVSLQKHLAGKFDIASTNLNLQLGSIKSPLLRATLNVITILPEILKGGGNNALSSLAGALLGGGRGASDGKSGGWSEELSQSPINVIQARGSMGAGRIELENALVSSRLFQATTRGDVTLAPILTNSTLNFPLSVSLTRSLAQRINMVPANTPTNQAFVPLPDYVAIKGTLGQPKNQINAKALVGTALQQLGGGTSDQKSDNLLQSLGGALSGQRPPNAPATNAAPARPQAAPATNRSSASAIPQGLGSLLGGQTNQAPAAGNTQTNRSRSRGLLDQLLQ